MREWARVTALTLSTVMELAGLVVVVLAVGTLLALALEMVLAEL